MFLMPLNEGKKKQNLSGEITKKHEEPPGEEVKGQSQILPGFLNETVVLFYNRDVQEEDRS